MSEDLPEGWIHSELGSIIQPSKKKAEPSQVNGRPYLGLEHIESGSNRIISYGDSSEVKSTTAVFASGDVLFSKLRPYLNKVAVATLDGVGSTEILVFEKRSYLHSKYLMWLLSQQSLVNIANERAAGVQLPRVTFDKISDITVPIPPLAEQHRIVERVEALLAEVNSAKERLAKVSVILKKFRQAVLSAACSGELTLEWRSGRGLSGERLLSRIRDVLRTTSRRSSGPDVDVTLDDLPEGWVGARVGGLVTLITSGSRGWAEYYSDAGPLFVRAQNINTDRLVLDDMAHVSPPAGSEGARTRVQTNDVLVTITGANVTKTARVEDDIGEAYVSQHVGLVRPAITELAPWLHTWLISPMHGRKQLLDAAYGAGKPGLNLDNLREVEVAVPPIEEQVEIQRQMHRLFKLADTIERRVQAAIAKSDKLPQAVLSKAFSGQLVPTEADLARAEGRDYEPASVLLERIRSETEETPKAKGSRKSNEANGPKSKKVPKRQARSKEA